MSRVSERQNVYQGTLGQTERSSVQISTDSGAIFRADVYASINAAEDPELEESLFRGGLNRVESPFSDQIYHPAIPLRYHDPDRRLFALIIPEALRHRELQLRRELLDELADESETVPDYVRNFRVVIGPGQLRQLAEEEPTADEGSRPSSAPAPPPSGSDAVPPEMESDSVEEAWEEIRRQQRDLAEQRQQLDEVSERIDRERRQMDEVEQQLQQDRRELEQQRQELEEERRELVEQREQLEEERRELEAEQLRLEEQKRSLEHPADGEGSAPATQVASEETQVVTEDQFISVEPEEEVVETEEPDAPRREASPVEEKVEFDPTAVEVTVEGTSDHGWSARWPGEEERRRFVDLADGDDPRFAARLDEERLASLTDETPEVFVQARDVEDYPIAGLVLARLDDDQVEASVGWPLDPSDERNARLFDRWTEEVSFEVALYDDAGDVHEVFHVVGPLEDNVQWIRHHLEAELDDTPEGTFEEAAETYTEPDFERVGTMRHNFDRPAFRELETSSQVKLATGVVGYWSEGDVFEYLISNRSYPLVAFRALQERVVEAALETGIYLNDPLRALALEIGIAGDEVELAERLLANFAEVSVQIRDNDLEPIDEWDNWEALIEFAQDVGVTPDPDVIELAESSLQRVREVRANEGDATADDTGGAAEPETDGAGDTGDDEVANEQAEDADAEGHLDDEASEGDELPAEAANADTEADRDGEGSDSSDEKTSDSDGASASDGEELEAASSDDGAPEADDLESSPGDAPSDDGDESQTEEPESEDAVEAGARHERDRATSPVERSRTRTSSSSERRERNDSPSPASVESIDGVADGGESTPEEVDDLEREENDDDEDKDKKDEGEEAEAEESDRESAATIVEHTSEATDTTYFVPASESIGSFETLDDMPRKELEAMLDDSDARLEAAQVLVERFDSSALSTVLEASESMRDPERRALARFLGGRAEDLEATLMQAVESGAPPATSIAIRALATIESKTALPSIIDAYCDPERELDREHLAEVLTAYGETLLPPLTREIQRSGANDEVVHLLARIEDTRDGTLEQLENDRHETVRDAAEQARNTSL